jgi:glycogen phosphorylase
VSATLQDILRRYKKHHHTFRKLPDKIAIQLNDTHPSIAIVELMRMLVDEENIPWDDAWEITKKTFAYTNHTVLPEALETWSEGLFSFLLPRHLQIIQEIDRRFMIQVREQLSEDTEQEGEMSIVTYNGEKIVHMARLAILGSHAVNGVSELHSDILQKRVFRGFYKMMPEKFTNVTNGVTPRRWLLQSNPKLASLITESIGDGWLKDLAELRNLEPLAEDVEFCRIFRRIKEENKEALSAYITATDQISFHPSSLLDCQIKRFHEYKRQILNILHIITLYNRVRKGRATEPFVPRVFLFAGKAAPSYTMCKLIIKLINSISAHISADPYIRERLQVVFLPNYSVTLAQQIIPAAEVSEQISTAGYEASGTSNMKFAINGALTIGTLDGANIEIRKEVGEENFFLFGLTEEEILAMRPAYRPCNYYETNRELSEAVSQISEGHFAPEEPHLFRPISDALLSVDPYFVMADYQPYVACQDLAAAAYLDKDRWTRMAILNVARSGKFSSDRAIRQYADNIWKISPVPV